MADDLVDLIHSLSKTEKRHIKLKSSFHEGEKLYMKLFELLECTVEYDAKQFQVEWKQAGYGDNLAITKHYLYDFILSSLEHYHAQAGYKATVQSLLKRVDILFDKALYKQCIKLLVKARKLAEKFETHRLLLEILVWELRLMLNPHYKGGLKKSLEELFEEEKRVIETLSQVNAARRSRFNIECVSAEELEELDEWISTSDQVFAICELQRFKATYYNQEGDYEAALEALDGELEILEQNYPLLQDRVGYSKYISAFGAALNICQERRITTKTAYYLERLNPEQTDRFFAKSDHLRGKVFVSYYIYYLNHLVSTKEHDQLLLVLNKIEQSKKTWRQKLQWKITAPLLYNVSRAYHVIGDFSSALKAIRELIGEKYQLEHERLILDGFWFQVVLHYEKRNMETLDYLLSSIQRKLKKAETIEAFDKKLLKLFKQIVDTASIKEQRNLLSAFLRNTSNWPSRKWLFDYKEWMVSKEKENG